jgi:hypothetical protein
MHLNEGAKCQIHVVYAGLDWESSASLCRELITPTFTVSTFRLLDLPDFFISLLVAVKPSKTKT